MRSYQDLENENDDDDNVDVDDNGPFIKKACKNDAATENQFRINWPVTSTVPRSDSFSYLPISTDIPSAETSAKIMKTFIIKFKPIQLYTPLLSCCNLSPDIAKINVKNSANIQPVIIYGRLLKPKGLYISVIIA